jgi:hypothetical protein
MAALVATISASDSADMPAILTATSFPPAPSASRYLRHVRARLGSGTNKPPRIG